MVDYSVAKDNDLYSVKSNYNFHIQAFLSCFSPRVLLLVIHIRSEVALLFFWSYLLLLVPWGVVLYM